MRAARVGLAIAVALALQTTLARSLTGDTSIIDLVLVAVVYIALTGGPVSGLIAGAIGGLSQDALATTGVSVIAVGSGVATARSIIGIGGLAKTAVGFVTGIIGTQFIVARPLPRVLVFFAATIGHAMMVMGLYAVLNPNQSHRPYGAILSQGAANALVGVLIFEVGEILPGFFDRRRATGSRMRINRRRMD